MSHYKKVCEFGKVHTQCRCPGPKRTIQIKCDRAGAHKPPEPPKPPTQVSIPDKPESVTLNQPWSEIVDDFLEPEGDLPTRIDSVLEARLWWMKTSERLSLLSDLMEEINKT